MTTAPILWCVFVMGVDSLKVEYYKDMVFSIRSAVYGGCLIVSQAAWACAWVAVNPNTNQDGGKSGCGWMGGCQPRRGQLCRMRVSLMVGHKYVCHSRGGPQGRKAASDWKITRMGGNPGMVYMVGSQPLVDSQGWESLLGVSLMLGYKFESHPQGGSQG